MKNPFVRKNAALMSSTALATQADALCTEVEADKATAADIGERLPELVGTPGFDAEVDRKVRLEAGIAPKLKALELLRADVVNVQNREKREAVEARHKAYELASAQLAARLKREVAKANQPWLALLADLKEDAAEGEKLRAEVRELGLALPVVNAEWRARSTPARDIPQKLEEMEFLVDSLGREISGAGVYRDGNRMDHLETFKIKKTVCTQSGGHIPAKMPTSFLETIKLFDLDGNQVLPPAS